MDDRRFDTLTRMLTGVLPRRHVGHVVSGLGLAGGLGLALAGESQGKKKGKKKKCKPCESVECNACESGQTTCGETCTDTLTDAQSCGRCGARCGQGEVCVEGLCWTSCPVASSCGSAGDIIFCSPNVPCLDVAGTPVCAVEFSCSSAINCTDASCPAGTACAAICCGSIANICVAPG